MFIMRQQHHLLGLFFLSALSSCGGIAVIDVDRGENTPNPTTGCSLHFADCNAEPQDGCEVDLRSDAANCGRCGHGCQGGLCELARCQPVIVAKGQGYVYHLAATETHVYWTNAEGSVVRIAQDGDPQVLVSGQNSPGDIAVNTTDVYWTNLGDGTILRMPLGGGVPVVVLGNAGVPWSIKVSDSMLVYVDNQSGDVRRLSLEPGSAPVTMATTPGSWGITMDATTLYWSTFAYGSLYSIPLGGGPTTTLVDHYSMPAEVVRMGDRILFGTNNDAGVYAVPVVGGATVTLFEKGGYGIAADEHHVYFGMYDGRIARVALDGGEPEILGMSEALPSDIVLTKTTAYWSAASTKGLLMKVAK